MTAVAPHRTLEGDDAELKRLNTAISDIGEIFDAHGIDLNEALNILCAALVNAIKDFEEQGHSRSFLVASVTKAIRLNLKQLDLRKARKTT